MVKNIISKLPNSLQKVLSNKIIFYGLVAISLINVLGYVSLNQWNALALYLSMMILMSFFSDNMTINILASLMISNCIVCANMLNYYTKFQGIKEGAKTNVKREKARYYKNKAGDCLDKSDPTAKNGGCKGLGCKKNCIQCYSKIGCTN